jgi:hypothetical protein
MTAMPTRSFAGSSWLLAHSKRATIIKIEENAIIPKTMKFISKLALAIAVGHIIVLGSGGRVVGAAVEVLVGDSGNNHDDDCCGGGSRNGGGSSAAGGGLRSSSYYGGSGGRKGARVIRSSEDNDTSFSDLVFLSVGNESRSTSRRGRHKKVRTPFFCFVLVVYGDDGNGTMMRQASSAIAISANSTLLFLLRFHHPPPLLAISLPFLLAVVIIITTATTMGTRLQQSMLWSHQTTRNTTRMQYPQPPRHSNIPN